jgi:hypothetical protein
VKPEDINLPQLSASATEWDRLLYRALWYQFRLNVERISAIERTLGTTTGKGGWINRKVTVITAATYTVLPDDFYLIENNAGAVTVTLPDAVTEKGRELVIRSITAQNVTSASANVVPLSGGAAGTAILSPVAGKWALLVSDGTVYQIMEGN